MKNTPMPVIKTCIMAGGAGTRFWPLSTELKPKQFIDITGSGRTMLQQTYDRALTFCAAENIYVLTHEQYRQLAKDQLPSLKEHQIICEPLRKNTAAAIAFSLEVLSTSSNDFFMVVLSADHWIDNDEAFAKMIHSGIEYAQRNPNSLFSVGIMPDKPHTGYGYLHWSEKLNNIYKIKSFVEKPNAENAAKYIQSGQYLWNAGIFLWHCSAIRNAFRQYAPDILEKFHGLDSTDPAAVFQAFESVRSESIDYAIMEKSDDIFALTGKFRWSDLGTYSALYQLHQPLENQNVIKSSLTHVENTTSSLILLPPEMTAVIRGLEGYIVCLHQNQLLIYPMDEEQNIKNSIQHLN